MIGEASSETVGRTRRQVTSRFQQAHGPRAVKAGRRENPTPRHHLDANVPNGHRLWGPRAAQPDLVAAGLRVVEAAVRGEQVRVVVVEAAAPIHRGVGRP
jgi:hypothetical protein